MNIITSRLDWKSPAFWVALGTAVAGFAGAFGLGSADNSIRELFASAATIVPAGIVLVKAVDVHGQHKVAAVVAASNTLATATAAAAAAVTPATPVASTATPPAVAAAPVVETTAAAPAAPTTATAPAVVAQPSIPAPAPDPDPFTVPAVPVVPSA